MIVTRSPPIAMAAIWHPSTMPNTRESTSVGDCRWMVTVAASSRNVSPAPSTANSSSAVPRPVAAAMSTSAALASAALSRKARPTRGLRTNLATATAPIIPPSPYAAASRPAWPPPPSSRSSVNVTNSTSAMPFTRPATAIMPTSTRTRDSLLRVANPANIRSVRSPRSGVSSGRRRSPVSPAPRGNRVR